MQLEQLIHLADRGRRYWGSLQLRVDEYVLLLPDYNEEYNGIYKRAFNDMLSKKKVTGRIMSVLDGSISEKDARALIQLYSLYRFTEQLIIGSLDKPYGRKIEHLTLLENMTLEKAIRAVLFGLEEK